MNINCSALFQFTHFFTCPDRIEDREEEEWLGVHNVDNVAVVYPLDPTRWWAHAGMLDDKPDETGER
jgi:hypothetical protein